jgi:uncharacterized protein with ATP-grasp and redox domains
MKEGGNKLPLDTIAKMMNMYPGENRFKNALNQLVHRFRKQVVRVEDDYLVLDKRVAEMTEEELFKFCKDIGKSITRIEKVFGLIRSNKDRVIAFLVGAIIGFTIGYALAKRCVLFETTNLPLCLMECENGESPENF